jgi:hypothetical protein
MNIPSKRPTPRLNLCIVVVVVVVVVVDTHDERGTSLSTSPQASMVFGYLCARWQKLVHNRFVDINAYASRVRGEECREPSYSVVVVGVVGFSTHARIHQISKIRNRALKDTVESLSPGHELGRRPSTFTRTTVGLYLWKMNPIISVAVGS